MQWPPYSGAGLQDIYTRMHVADFDYFIYIHVVMAANLRQLVGKRDVYSAEGVFYNLCHLGCFDVSNDNFALTEGGAYNSALTFSPTALSSAPMVRLL